MAFVRLLNERDIDSNGDPATKKQKIKGRAKGDARRVVLCGEVQKVVFGDNCGSEEKARNKRGVVIKEWKSVDMEDTDPTLLAEEDPWDSENVDEGDEVGGVPIHLPSEEETTTSHQSSQQPTSHNPADNFYRTANDNVSIGEDEAVRRKAGMLRAEQRELVRQAARRGVAFGFEGERRGVEAIQGKRVVEASFAKGEWGVRWRE